MLKVFDYKYIIPPIATGLFICLARPRLFLHFLLLQQSINSILSITGLLFTLGFVISTFGYFLINVTGFSLCPLDEMRNWLRLGEANEYFQKRMSTRWDMIALNVNSLVGMTIVFMTVTYLNLHPAAAWWLIAITFTAAVIYNLLCAMSSFDAMRSILKSENPTPKIGK